MGEKRRKTDQDQCRWGEMLLYLGVNREQFESIHSQVNRQNRRVLEAANLIAGIVVITLLGASCLPILSEFLGKFRAAFALSAIAFVIIRTMPELLGKNPRSTLICCYMMIGALYGLAILTGPVYDHENLSTTFLVMLFATPFLIVDIPVRVTLSSVIASFIFMIVSLANKEPGLLGYDVINCIIFLIASTLMDFYIQRLRISQMTYIRQIETERDTDGLTKLLTKDAGRTQIEEEMKAGRQGALIIFDLDNFKEVNDTYGHLIGDTILSAVGMILKQSFRAQDITSRFGGDEFLIYMSGVTDSELIEQRAAQIHDQMAELAAKLPGADTVSCSFGVAFFSADETQYLELFERADQALYSAKQSGKDQLQFY
ncbi:MAG: GGDEF domain-containing protein [Candidatus Saccharibacteria bacterium]|nr:GGDEF domain-containing protein [Candidatus Saccharibacteria bacterium]